MGYINKLSCQCGYVKELRVGTGRRIPDVAYVDGQFSKDSLSKFHAALNSGSLGKLFYIENTMSYCKKCNDIKEGKMLHYEINGNEKTVHEPCQDCGHEMELVDVEKPLCPKCGKVLDVEMGGLWD